MVRESRARIIDGRSVRLRSRSAAGKPNRAASASEQHLRGRSKANGVARAGERTGKPHRACVDMDPRMELPASAWGGTAR